MTVRRRSILRNAGAIAGANLLGRGLRFIYVAVLARLLGPEALGVYSAGVAFYLALSIFGHFGQGPFLAARLTRRASGIAATLRRSLALRLTATLAVASLGLAYTWLIEPSLETALAGTAFMAALAARSVALWVRESFIAVEDTAWIPRWEAGFTGGEVALGIGLAISGVGVAGLAALHAAAWLAQAVLALRRLAHRQQIALRPSWPGRALSPLAWRGAQLIIAYGFLNLFAQSGIVTLKLSGVDPAQIAYLALAVQLVMAVGLFPVALGTAAMPAIGRSLRRDGGIGLDARLAGALGIVLLCSALTALALGAVAPWLVTALFGAAYGPAAAALGWAVWILPPYGVAAVGLQALAALDRRGAAALGAAAMVCATVAVTTMLAGQLEPASAAAAAMAMAATSGALVALLGIARRLGHRAVGGPAILVLAVTGVAAVTPWVAAWVTLPLALGLLAAAWFAGVPAIRTLGTAGRRLGWA